MSKADGLSYRFRPDAAHLRIFVYRHLLYCHKNIFVKIRFAIGISNNTAIFVFIIKHKHHAITNSLTKTVVHAAKLISSLRRR